MSGSVHSSVVQQFARQETISSLHPDQFADRITDPQRLQVATDVADNSARMVAEYMEGKVKEWLSPGHEYRIGLTGGAAASVKAERIEKGGGQATVIAWLWTRTVRCPNPTCGSQMPLARSFRLSSKSTRKAWVEPIVEGNEYRFDVRMGTGSARQGTVNRRGASCLCCRTPVPFDYIRSEGKAGRMGRKLMAIVAEGLGERIYASPSHEHENIALQAVPDDLPDTDLPEQDND